MTPPRSLPLTQSKILVTRTVTGSLLQVLRACWVPFIQHMHRKCRKEDKIFSVLPLSYRAFPSKYNFSSARPLTAAAIHKLSNFGICVASLLYFIQASECHQIKDTVTLLPSHCCLAPHPTLFVLIVLNTTVIMLMYLLIDCLTHKKVRFSIFMMSPQHIEQ